MRLTDSTDAITAFVDAATEHARATEAGDFKSGNRAYRVMVKSVAFLEEHDCLWELEALLDAQNTGVRLWAATYLLAVREEESKVVLRSIAKKGGIMGLTADTTLSEWTRGNLQT